MHLRNNIQLGSGCMQSNPKSIMQLDVTGCRHTAGWQSMSRVVYMHAVGKRLRLPNQNKAIC